ncbi:hypothetical protein VNO77_15312 [Canavalia gladiata]|uniref:Uncharacterized protein n=1 Tax=Canavalia gladiata TaxID=3824 RepID=A0AAN9QRB5_CANGL
MACSLPKRQCHSFIVWKLLNSYAIPLRLSGCRVAQSSVRGIRTPAPGAATARLPPGHGHHLVSTLPIICLRPQIVGLFNEIEIHWIDVHGHFSPACKRDQRPYSPPDMLFAFVLDHSINLAYEAVISSIQQGTRFRMNSPGPWIPDLTSNLIEHANEHPHIKADKDIMSIGSIENLSIIRAHCRGPMEILRCALGVSKGSCMALPKAHLYWRP